MTKAELYGRVDDLRSNYDFAATKDPLCVQRLCERMGILVDIHPFKTQGLRGAALIDSMAICLDEGMEPKRRKFYCAHELFHFIFHNDMLSVYCYDHAGDTEKAVMEWEANEAAELVLPRRAFLKYVADQATNIHTGREYYKMRKQMAYHFGVSHIAAITRFDALKYEIIQYMQGVPLEDIEIMSARQQKAVNVFALSMNDVYRTMHVKHDMNDLTGMAYKVQVIESKYGPRNACGG